MKKSYLGFKKKEKRNKDIFLGFFYPSKHVFEPKFCFLRQKIKFSCHGYKEARCVSPDLPKIVCTKDMMKKR